MSELYSITEYGTFISKNSPAATSNVSGCVVLPENTFNQLEEFILANKNRDTDALELLGLSARRGFGKIITAKNYVGLIAMNSGDIIEILPKIARARDDEKSEEQKMLEAKNLLLEMIKSLKDPKYKNMQAAALKSDKVSLFEIFIRMYIDEVFSIVKGGLRCAYETVEENAPFVKGKILFDKNIKYNFAHKELNYIQYDEFDENRAENKLLKSTLKYLYKHTQSMNNKKDLKTLLNSFSEVEYSDDYEKDFNKVVIDRGTKHYENALIWSRVFLQGKSFTNYSGSETAFALLFPMDKLFESYVASKFASILDSKRYIVSAQDSRFTLFDAPKKFQLKPDIVIRDKIEGKIYLLDTKWKMLSKAYNNYGINQGDMYQMYAYQKKYQSENVTLLYPVSEIDLADSNISYTSEDNCKVMVHFVDLINIKMSIEKVMERITA